MKKFKRLALMSATTLAVLIGAVTFLPLRAIAGLETPCNFISDLVATNPLSSDLASTGDDHLRCIKSAVKGSFPNVSGAVTSSHTELNLVDGITGTVWSSGNDGAGSGLDADLLDGSSSAAFAQLAIANTFTLAGTVGSPTVNWSSTRPLLRLTETDGAANNQIWYLQASSEQFDFGIANDAVSSSASIMTVDRTGASVDLVNFPSSAVQMSLSGTGTAPSVDIASARPVLRFNETDGSANNKFWVFDINGEQFNARQITDAGGGSAPTWLSVDATAGTIDSINLQATAVQTNGVDITASASSFTGTLTGMSGATTGTVNYRKIGNLVTLYATAQISGTSNANTFTMTGLPAAVQPVNAVKASANGCINNATGNTLCGVSIAAGGSTITFGILSTDFFSSTGWLNSGTKGLEAGWQVTYTL